jgi:serine/threonine-protein kinase
VAAPDLQTTLQAALRDTYRIEREFTRGGMAIIYTAEDLKHHRKVAIKVLRPNLAATLGPDRFLREIEIAARLTHPHILPLHDSGSADGLLYFVMPFIAGESLRERLGREHQLAIPDAVGILRQLLDALAYAHAEGVIHRDIKPENVLLAGRNAMVIDFGVAKALSLAAHTTGRSTLGIVLGTPEYVSPEQAGSHPAIDHRTDLYAVGAMAYELLTGQPPFTHKDPLRVLAAQIHHQPRPVTEQRRMPAPLAELVMRSLRKPPEERWQCADDMLAQLDLMTAAPAPPRSVRTPLPQPPPPLPAEPPERPWKGIILLTLIAAAVVVLLGVTALVFLTPIR